MILDLPRSIGKDCNISNRKMTSNFAFECRRGETDSLCTNVWRVSNGEIGNRDFLVTKQRESFIPISYWQRYQIKSSDRSSNCERRINSLLKNIRFDSRSNEFLRVSIDLGKNVLEKSVVNLSLPVRSVWHLTRRITCVAHLTQFLIRIALYSIVQVTRVMDHVFLFYESLIGRRSIWAFFL